METYLNEEQVKPTLKEGFIGKVYTYMALALAITGVVAIGFSYLFSYLWDINASASLMTYNTIIIISSIVLIILTFVMNIKAVRNTNSLFLLIIYATVWGIFASSFVYYINDPVVLGLTFLVTAFIFLGVSLIGYFMKGKKLGLLVKIVTGLILVAGLLSIVNLCILPFTFLGGSGAFEAYSWIYLIIEICLVGYMILMVVIDTFKMKKLAAVNDPVISNSLAITCAYTLYSDFVLIFLYLLKFIALFVASNRN